MSRRKKKQALYMSIDLLETQHPDSTSQCMVEWHVGIMYVEPAEDSVSVPDCVMPYRGLPFGVQVHLSESGCGKYRDTPHSKQTHEVGTMPTFEFLHGVSAILVFVACGERGPV